MLHYTSVSDDDIVGSVLDYSEAYPNGKLEILVEVTVAELKSREITVNDEKVTSSGLPSSARAWEVAGILKE